MLRAIKSSDDDPKKKLFQFLNTIGARALRMHMGRVLEMAESSTDKFEYENKIADRFGGQRELELIVPTPSGIPPADQEDSAFLEAVRKLAWRDEDDRNPPTEAELAQRLQSE